MNRTKYIILTILTIVCLGCTSEESFNDNGSIEVVASLANTRTAFIEEGEAVSVHWNIDDKIGLFASGQDNLQYTALSTGATTTFGNIANELKAQEGETVYAYYPYSESTEGVRKVEVPDLLNQYYGRNVSDLDFIYASGIVNGDKLFLQFKHLFAFLRITLPVDLISDRGERGGLCIQSTEIIASHSDNNLLSFNLEDENSLPEGYNALWYYISANEDFGSQQEITCYIAILPQTENAWLSIYKLKDGVTYAEDCLVQKQAPTGGFKAGNVYTLSLDDNLPKTEREALVALYRATDGDNWINNENWCTDKPVSEWYGIVANENGVIGINLNGNKLTGSVTLDNLELLQYLNLSNNELTELHLNNLQNLYSISCGGNQMTALTVNNCPNLIDLWCYENQLAVLDLDNSCQLVNLVCYNNRITSIDVSSYTELESIICTENLLTTLDVDNNTKLRTLWCGNNLLSSLNVSNNSLLESLLCNSNQLTALDVGSNCLLKTLWCDYNQLSTLDVGNNRELEVLYCASNQLSVLETRNCPNLRDFVCNGNLLQELDVSDNLALEQLSTLANPNLLYIYISPGQQFQCTKDDATLLVTKTE